ncbi:VanZ family protein [Tetragenococcus muriaticus]|uniref:VanZ family protein n=1 Tax=Tetragenococcus muriaticus TaxID=64642 RepID=UPI0003F65075|nr:VanZ family protein [Tetragenococcus muriaticus]GMA48108.1 membrane protein [Tetragenococcus muriaticus]
MLKKARKNGNFYFVFPLVIMAVLFYSSAQTYETQSQLSLLERLLSNEPFKETLENVSFQYADDVVSIEEKGYFSFVEFFIRKLAHFGSYFLLGSGFFLSLLPKIKTIGFAAFFSWLSATGYAGMDEFHQMLTQDRTPLFQDVMLDSFGALTAILLCCLIFSRTKRRAL